MLSIEDAAKSLQRTYLAAGFAAISGNKDTIKAAFAAHEDAARDLALAVLDDEHSTLRRCNCITWAEGDRCRDYKASRTKIENLGK